MPVPPLRNARLLLACALLPFASACQADAANAPERPELGLMGTIPIYWGEAGGLGELVSVGGNSHWARARLESRFTLEPLDSLAKGAISPLRFLLLAQPRALSPDENVALDEWVRDGGRLLLFADPMLTGHSRFAIGDRRRPQDVILLSPILEHWGLKLVFDAGHPEQAAAANAEGLEIPVNRPGAFVLAPGARDCALSAGGIVARCRIGRGEVTMLADAAVLDLYDPDPAAPAALDALVERAFQ